jgi:hypothetical protein
MAEKSPNNQLYGFRPISEAPIRSGEAWGPAVIFPSETGWFAFAEWDGYVFVNTVTGALLDPIGFQSLPHSPASISFKT